MQLIILLILFLPISVFALTPTPTPTATPTPCTFVVDSTGDAGNLVPGCTCATASSTCTLRAAFETVQNCSCVRSEIDFNIPGADPNCNTGSCLITSDGNLLTNKLVKVAGTTQPGTICPSSCDGVGRFFSIILVGSATQHSTFANAITLSGVGSSLEGIFFVDFTAPLAVSGGTCLALQNDNTSTRCSEFSSCGTGILIGGFSGIHVGGPNPSDRVMLIANQNAIASSNSTNTLLQNVTIKSGVFPGIFSVNDTSLAIDNYNGKYVSQDGIGLSNCTNCSITNSIVGLDCDGVAPFGNGLRPICAGSGFPATDGKECFTNADCPAGTGTCASSPAINVSGGGSGNTIDSCLIGSNFGSGIENNATGTVISNNVIGWDISQTLDRCNGQPQIKDFDSATLTGNIINPACVPTPTPTPILGCAVVIYTPGTDCDTNCGGPGPPTPTPDTKCVDNFGEEQIEAFVPLCSAPTPRACGVGCCLDRWVGFSECSNGCSTPTPTITPTSTPTNTGTTTPTPTITPCTACAPTQTPSNTFTITPTSTPTSTSTRTPTYSPTSSPTSTLTVTNTPTRTSTSLPSPTCPSICPPTGTPTSSPTITLSRTPTNTKTRTPSPSPIKTTTKTPTLSPTSTFTATFTITPTNTFTETFTVTPTNTPTLPPGPNDCCQYTVPVGGNRFCTQGPPCSPPNHIVRNATCDPLLFQCVSNER